MTVQPPPSVQAISRRSHFTPRQKLGGAIAIVVALLISAVILNHFRNPPKNPTDKPDTTAYSPGLPFPAQAPAEPEKPVPMPIAAPRLPSFQPAAAGQPAKDLALDAPIS